MSRKKIDLEVQFYHAVVSCSYGALRDALERGVDPNTCYGDTYNNNKTNILSLACERGLTESVRILVNAGANAGLQDRWGQTPLMYACYSQYSEVVDLLLSSQPEIIHIKDNRGKTALHCALESGSEQCVSLILKYGCDINVVTHSGITLLMTLSRETQCEGIETLTGLLLDAGANLEVEELREKRTALQIAVVMKNIRAVKLLLAAGARVNVQEKYGRTPLTNLIYQNVRHVHNRELDQESIDIMDTLIQSGADMNMVESSQCNPLILSASLMTEPFIRYLLKKGAKPDLIVQPGITPLLLSVDKRDVLSIKTLIQWNCRMDIRGVVKRQNEELFVDPFELALTDASWDIVRMFVLAGYNLSRNHYLLINEYLYDQIPNPLRHNPGILERLQQMATCPMSLFHIALLELWKSLKCDTEKRLIALSLPKQLNRLICDGNFLTDMW